MVAALEWAVAKRDEWSSDREIAATNLEVLHAFMLSFLKGNGGKNLGKPIHIERPWEKDKKKPMVSAGAFAAMVGGARG